MMEPPSFLCRPGKKLLFQRYYSVRIKKHRGSNCERYKLCRPTHLGSIYLRYRHISCKKVLYTTQLLGMHNIPEITAHYTTVITVCSRIDCKDLTTRFVLLISFKLSQELNARKSHLAGREFRRNAQVYSP